MKEYVMVLAPQHQYLILHVDDEPSFRDLTATFLELKDGRLAVETATSAEEGPEQISSRPPDCVVSDYNMPGMDGVELLQAVLKKYPEPPSILFTGNGSEAVANDAIAADVTDYLQKRSGSKKYELLANRIRNAVKTRRESKWGDTQEYEMDVRLTTPDEEHRWITTRGERVSDGASGNVVRGYIQDITERREWQQELQRNKSAMDEAPVGISMTDPLK